MSAILFLFLGISGIDCQQKPVATPAAENTHTIMNRWFRAIRENNVAQLDQMQKQYEIDWNFKNEHQHTSLMSACHFGHYNLIRKLIDLNVDVNVLDQKNFNALSYAVYGRADNETKSKIINLLLEHHADPFVENEFKTRALFTMIEYKISDPLYHINWGLRCEAYPEKDFSIVKYAQKHRQYYLAAFLQHNVCP